MSNRRLGYKRLNWALWYRQQMTDGHAIGLVMVTAGLLQELAYSLTFVPRSWGKSSNPFTFGCVTLRKVVF